MEQKPHAYSARWRVAGALVVLTLAAFWPVLACGFTNYDDDQYVTQNPVVQQGLTPAGIAWAFTTGHSGNYHPLTWLSLMADAQVFGMDPHGYHLTNLVLHALNVALVFLLLTTMTGAMWRSALVAALFAVHPLRVESVAWVSERKDVLSACFGLLALLAYVHYARRPGVARYLLVLLLLAMSLLAKPMLVTFPALLLLLDYWPLRRWQGSPQESTATLFQSSINNQQSTIPLTPLLLEKLPFALLAIASSIATFIAQHHAGATVKLAIYSPTQRLANAAVAYGRYLKKIFWPTNLAIPYMLPFQWPAWVITASVAGLIIITALVIIQRRRRPWLLVGWLWFVGMLIPVIGLVQVGHQSMADRYTYLPVVGLLIAIIWSLPAKLSEERWAKLTVIAAASVILSVCVVLTNHQIAYWRDSETLFRHTLAVTGPNWVVYDQLGNTLLVQNKLKPAAAALTAALALHPDDAMAACDLGIIQEKEGHIDAAIKQYIAALAIDPHYAIAHYNLAQQYSARSQWGPAIFHYRAALRTQPDLNAIHTNLAVALSQHGQGDEAITEFAQAAALDPQNPQARGNLAMALAMQGRTKAALDQFQTALALDPRNLKILKNYAWLLAGSRQTQQAIACYKTILQLDPHDTASRRLLAQLQHETSATPGISPNTTVFPLHANNSEAMSSKSEIRN